VRIPTLRVPTVATRIDYKRRKSVPGGFLLNPYRDKMSECQNVRFDAGCYVLDIPVLLSNYLPSIALASVGPYALGIQFRAFMPHLSKYIPAQ
jgi:hypothetical protein